MSFPRVRSSVRTIMVAVAVIATTLAVSGRVYRQVVPIGADFFPFWIASDGGPTLASPDRQRIVRVVFNDAGGAHSGNHWTWLVVEDVITGKRSRINVSSIYLPEN